MKKSRLFVFQLKELIYTLVFIILSIILVVVLYTMFNKRSLTQEITPTPNIEISYNNSPLVYPIQSI